MQALTIPVAPFIGTADGHDDVVLSLLRLAPAERLRLVLPEQLPTLRAARVRMASSSIEALAELGITSAASVAASVSGSVRCFEVEMLATAWVDNEDKESYVEAAEIGVGFRIGVVGFNFDSKLSIDSVAQLAAAATLKSASSVFEVSVIGAGLGALRALQPLILAAVGPFDTMMFHQLGAAQTELAMYLQDHRDELVPNLLSVQLNPTELVKFAYPAGSDDLKNDARSQTFALERALRGITLDDALKDKRVQQYSLNEGLIRHVYEVNLELGPGQRPTDPAKRAANRVLAAGRY